MTGTEFEVWKVFMSMASLMALIAFSITGIMLRVGQRSSEGLAKGIDEKLDARFQAQEEIRSSAATHWESRFDGFAAQLKRLEQEQIATKMEMLRDYQRKEDAIRQDTVLQAKLDALNARLELIASAVVRAERRPGNE